MKSDRVVVGTSSEQASKIDAPTMWPFRAWRKFYFVMDERSSEMTKYAANAFLTTKIAFMNKVANLCEHTGANVDWVRGGIGSDARIGKEFLYAGMGIDGSCFAKNVRALAYTAGEYGYSFPIPKVVLTVNAQQKMILFDPICRHFLKET